MVKALKQMLLFNCLCGLLIITTAGADPLRLDHVVIAVSSLSQAVQEVWLAGTDATRRFFLLLGAVSCGTALTIGGVSSDCYELGHKRVVIVPMASSPSRLRILGLRLNSTRRIDKVNTHAIWIEAFPVN